MEQIASIFSDRRRRRPKTAMLKDDRKVQRPSTSQSRNNKIVRVSTAMTTMDQQHGSGTDHFYLTQVSIPSVSSQPKHQKRLSFRERKSIEKNVITTEKLLEFLRARPCA